MNKKLLSVLTASIFGLSALGANAVTVTLDQQKTEVKQQMEQIKKLPKEQRKQKIDDLKNRYPEVFKNKRMGKGHKRFEQFAAKYPQLANEINQIKQLPKEQRKERMKELKAKYPDVFKKGDHKGHRSNNT